MRYLALGDSYTIGELVDYEQNFPSQTVTKLQQAGIDITLDKLIAVTGWTTDELAASLEKENPSHHYDWVTLLIGVNNQYRGRALEEYRWQFYSLLCQSVFYAQGHTDRVIVLSIPDWGLTPFNKEKDLIEVSNAIDDFNRINFEITQRMGCHYVDVTASTREHATNIEYLAKDLLHYSGKEYEIWAEKVKNIILSVMSKS